MFVEQALALLRSAKSDWVAMYNSVSRTKIRVYLLSRNSVPEMQSTGKMCGFVLKCFTDLIKQIIRENICGFNCLIRFYNCINSEVHKNKTQFLIKKFHETHCHS